MQYRWSKIAGAILASSLAGIALVFIVGSLYVANQIANASPVEFIRFAVAAAYAILSFDCLTPTPLLTLSQLIRSIFNFIMIAASLSFLWMMFWLAVYFWS